MWINLFCTVFSPLYWPHQLVLYSVFPLILPSSTCSVQCFPPYIDLINSFCTVFSLIFTSSTCSVQCFPLILTSSTRSVQCFPLILTSSTHSVQCVLYSVFPLILTSSTCSVQCFPPYIALINLFCTVFSPLYWPHQLVLYSVFPYIHLINLFCTVFPSYIDLINSFCTVFPSYIDLINSFCTVCSVQCFPPYIHLTTLIVCIEQTLQFSCLLKYSIAIMLSVKGICWFSYTEKGKIFKLKAQLISWLLLIVHVIQQYLLAWNWP